MSESFTTKMIMESIDLLKIVAAVCALAIAIIGHEIMHGLVAFMYGDTTAKDAKRLSLNPLVHVDPVGTLLVPALMYFVPILLGAGGGFLFGWAKPVPINGAKVLQNGGYNALMKVDLAGIFYNFALASFASFVLFHMPKPIESDSIFYIFGYILVLQLVIINVVLGVFNLLPIPQFDGAQFLTHLSLKHNIYKVAHFYQKYDRYGILVVLLIIATPLKDYLLFMPVQFILGLLSP